DDQGHRTGFEQIDPRFQKRGHLLNYTAQAIAKFLQSASRATVETDGTVSFEPNANQNIIVMETEGDKALYQRIRDIMHSPPEGQIARFKNEIHGKDEGELAINRIIKEMPFKMPAMIVSDDTRYFNETAP